MDRNTGTQCQSSRAGYFQHNNVSFYIMKGSQSLSQPISYFNRYAVPCWCVAGISYGKISKLRNIQIRSSVVVPSKDLGMELTTSLPTSVSWCNVTASYREERDHKHDVDKKNAAENIKCQPVCNGLLQ